MFIQRLLKPSYTAPKPIPQPPDHDSADILARTLWGEARGETLAGIEAVANVIMNRVRFAQDRGGFWWGDDITAVCQKPYQFSCWNKNDPNYFKLLAVTPDDRAFAMCQRVARRAVNNVLTDNTMGATHYHNDSVSPSWTRHQSPTTRIGNHTFYRITT